MKNLLLLFIVCLPLAAQAGEDSRRIITVSGEAKQEFAPDQAVVNVEVYNENKSLSQAKKNNDEKLQALLAVAKAQGIVEKSIKTLHAYVQPRYEYIQPPPNPQGQTVSARQVLVGYIASQNLQVTFDNIEKIGGFIDALVEKKIDRINGINFQLKDQKKSRDEVMLKALEDARTKASRMAQVLGQQIGKPVMVSDNSPQPVPYPVRGMAMMKSESMATDGAMPTTPPPGVIEITQNVSVTFELQ